MDTNLLRNITSQVHVQQKKTIEKATGTYTFIANL